MGMSKKRDVLALLMLIAVLTASVAIAQEASSHAVPYCADLKRVAALATTKERFGSIAGQLRQGNFLETSLTLSGWKDCVLYGTRTYACDSPAWSTPADAETTLVAFIRDIKDCLGETWSEVADRSSPGYTVLHDLRHPVSITLSIDRTDDMKHVVRLIVFVRGSEGPR